MDQIAHGPRRTDEHQLLEQRREHRVAEQLLQFRGRESLLAAHRLLQRQAHPGELLPQRPCPLPQRHHLGVLLEPDGDGLQRPAGARRVELRLAKRINAERERDIPARHADGAAAQIGRRAQLRSPLEALRVRIAGRARQVVQPDAGRLLISLASLSTEAVRRYE